MDLIFPNGVKVSARKFKLLSAIPTDPANDKQFINSAFFVFITEKKIKKQIKKGLERNAILEYFRDSSKCEMMRSIYEHRILTDGNGDTKGRIRDFKHTFRVKFNNWWRTNMPKPKN